MTQQTKPSTSQKSVPQTNKQGVGTDRKMSTELESDVQADGIPGSDRDIQGRPVEVYVDKDKASSRSLSDEDVAEDEVASSEYSYKTTDRSTGYDEFDSQI
jgi:hypothetical protein